MKSAFHILAYSLPNPLDLWDLHSDMSMERAYQKSAPCFLFPVSDHCVLALYAIYAYFYDVTNFHGYSQFLTDHTLLLGF